MTTQEQDLRTGIWYCHGATVFMLKEEPGRYRNGQPRLVNDHSFLVQGPNAEAVAQQIHSALAAPPRPVDAERVEFDSQNQLHWAEKYRDEFIKRMTAEAELRALASPAHSPDKAVTREGVELVDSWPMHYSPEFLAARDAELEKQRAEVAALATKPTGTEAGRGVGNPDAAKWAETLRNSIRASGQKGWSQFHDTELGELIKVLERAATPTPPVSPSPDSTGPAEARVFDDWDVDAVACTMMDAGIAKEPAWNWAKTALDKVAALTPSAPIADPVREWEIVERMCRAFVGPAWGARAFQGAEHYRNRMRDVLASLPTPASDVPGDAQTQEGGR